MKKRFIFAVMVFACLAFAGTAIADQIIEGGTPENPIEYEWGLTDNLVVIGTGNLAPSGGSPDPNEGNIYGHAWLGGPGSIVNQELAIGKPGFKKSTMSGYDPDVQAIGSLVLREDDTYGYKTVGGLTVDGDLNIGGGAGGVGQLFIPVGSVEANSGINVGIGRNAHGTIAVQGGSFTISSTSTMKLGDSEDPETTGVVPIGNGELSISGGSVTTPSGSSLIVGSMGGGRLAVIGSAITAINLSSVDVTESGVVAFTLDAGSTSPDVKTINSGGHFYLADGSIIDMDFLDQGVETLLSNYDDASAERVIDLITSPDLKWNESGYHVALSPEDAPGWIMQENGNTLQVKYLGGTGSDLIVNTGTTGSPTAIAADSYRDIYIGYGLEVETPIVATGHASINGAAVASTSDTYIAYGDNCEGSLTIGSGGSLNVFAGSLTLGTGNGANATLTLTDDANLNVMYYLLLSDAAAPPTLINGTADLNIADSATLTAQYLMVGGYDNPSSACSVNQTGGSVALRNNLYIGRNSEAGAEGSSYTISGNGNLDVGGAINVGFDNVDASASSTLHVDGSGASVSAEDLNVAETCTLKFTVDAGADFTGDVTPIYLTKGGYGSFAYFQAQYNGDVLDEDHCAIIDMAFEPGAESLIAALPMDDPRRGLDIIRIYTHWNLKWQMNDTGYDENGSIVDHLYGFKLTSNNWAISEVAKENVTYNKEGYGKYAILRLIYTGPQGPMPMPTADAGPDQLGLVAEEPVTLDASGSSVTEGRSIVSYEWQWDDGDLHRIVDTSPITQTYFSVGTHTVSLIVTSDIGETDTDTCVISIPSARIPGDIDASDIVDLGDFVILKNHFGEKDPDMP